MKTEAHRLKEDRDPGSRARGAVKGQRVKHHQLSVMPSDLPKAEAPSKKKKRKKKKSLGDSDD